jgi:hypothetical protein
MNLSELAWACNGLVLGDDWLGMSFRWWISEACYEKALQAYLVRE